MNEAMGQSRDHTPPENGSLSAEAGMDSIHAGPLGDYGAGTKPDEVVEPGRALALTDFSPPSLGTGERLLRLAYRLGVPAATLAAPFRKPAKTRLLATVLNPLAGQKMAGTAIRAGHFLVHGVKAPIAQIDFAGAARMAPPLERVVHSFSWLADLEASAPREQVAPVAERVLAACWPPIPRPRRAPAKVPPGPWVTPARASSTGWSMPH